MDRERPEQVVRDTGQRVLSAARTVLEASPAPLSTAPLARTACPVVARNAFQHVPD